MPTPIADMLKSYGGGGASSPSPSPSPSPVSNSMALDPNAYAAAHTAQEMTSMQKAGALVPIDKFLDMYSGHYSKAEEFNNTLAMKGADVQKAVAEKEATAPIDLAVAKAKQAQEDFRTKPLSADDSDVAAKASQAWGTLNELNQYYQTANKSNGNLVAGPAGGLSAVEHYNESAWAPDDVKALNVMRETAKASLATALVGMTAGKEGATGPMSMMEDLMPKYSDTPQQWQNKQGILQDMLANRIGPWYKSRAMANTAGNPMYDTSSIQDLLKPINNRYAQILQNQNSTATSPTSVLTPEYRTSMLLLKQQHTAGTNPPQAQNTYQPGQPQAIGPSPMTPMTPEYVGTGSAMAYGGGN